MSTDSLTVENNDPFKDFQEKPLLQPDRLIFPSSDDKPPLQRMWVSLPKYHHEDGHLIRTGMHTDNIAIFVRALMELSQRTQANLLIQGRCISQGQWNQLQQQPVFDFFINGRANRSSNYNKKRAYEYLVPYHLRESLTPKQMNQYQFMDFSPATLSAVAYEEDASRDGGAFYVDSDIPFGVGYYSARRLLGGALGIYSSNGLLPILGGVNTFQIGSDTLGMGIIRSCFLKLTQAFENEQFSVHKPLPDKLRELWIRAGASPTES